MKPIVDKKSLLDFVLQHAPSTACERAIREGRATVVGGFTPPDDLPGWLVRLWSEYGREWYIRVWCDEKNHRYSARTVTDAELPTLMMYKQAYLAKRFQ